MSALIKSCLLAFLITAASMSVIAVPPDEVKAIQTKAALAHKQLKIAAENGKNISVIVRMMKRVKALGDKGRVKDASELLDKILIEFRTLNGLPLAQKHGQADPGTFTNPRRVNIIGYEKDAMEAFIARDGKILFFNSETHKALNSSKDIYYARRIDDTNFEFMGEVRGVNSDEVDGVPSMDNHANFYYVSTANYGRSNGFATVYSGKFHDGKVSNIRSHPELSLKTPGWVNMDIEISADGKTLYATHTDFRGGPPPKQSYFFRAHLKDGRFVVDKQSDDIFRNINSGDAEYAASISSDELDIYFTRLNQTNGFRFSSYRATRTSKNAPFSVPMRIAAITGIAEAPAITSDGKLMYFHKKDQGRFFLYVLERAVN